MRSGTVATTKGGRVLNRLLDALVGFVDRSHVDDDVGEPDDLAGWSTNSTDWA
jgi:hypothetical protein